MNTDSGGIVYGKVISIGKEFYMGFCREQLVEMPEDWIKLHWRGDTGKY